MDVKPQPLPANANSTDWSYFRDRFTDYLVFSELTSTTEQRKKALLLITIGRDGADILEGLPEPKTTFSQCIARLNEYFGEKSSILLRRKTFFSARQEPKESANSFACRLRRLSTDCEFGAYRDILLRDIFVIGIFDDRLGEKLLAEDESSLTFDLAIRKAEAFDRARQERASAKPTLAAVKHSRFPEKASESGNRMNFSSRSYKPASNQKRHCYRCGSNSHIASQKCPAFKSCCRKCGKTGHWANVCRSGDTKPRIRQLLETDEKQCENFNLFFTNGSDETKRTVKINNKSQTIIIDTGAEANVLTTSLGIPLELSPSLASVQAWGKFNIPVSGKATCSVSYNGKEVNAEFLVVDLPGDANSLPLFSLKLSRELGMIDELCVRRTNTNILRDNADLFDGIGQLNTGFQYKISLDESVKPKNIPARRLPPAILDAVRTELERMQKYGIISPVTEPTEWCSPMLVTRKKSGDIRIVVDFRYLNTAIRRQNFQLPRLDDILPLLADAKMFSALDGVSGYLQIPVHDESKAILTFSSPFGRFSYNRLPFGINSASEVYQQVISDLFSGISGVVCYQDDILIYGQDEKQHQERLHVVLERLKAVGLKLNRDKCKFGVDELDFLGHHISSKGISPSPEKVKSLSEMPIPMTADSLRSFLGMAAYLGQRYVPNFSSLCQPLWSLLKANTFAWTEEARAAFYEMRKQLATPVTLAYYNNQKATVLAVDAGPHGLGATITQEGKLVACASRKLSDTETRYSQIEREFLAIVYGIHKFRSLLLGQRFKVTTDHKPLLPFFRRQIDTLPLRIQRWILTLQPYDFEVEFINGKNNSIADGLSRNPASIDSFPEENVEYTVCFILKQAPLDLKRIAEEMKSDRMCNQLIRSVNTGRWTLSMRRAFAKLFARRNELSCKESSGLHIVCFGDRVYVPSSMRQSILQQAHQSHLGVQKMKEILRAYVWWEDMRTDIENFVKRCSACTKHRTTVRRAPLQPIDASYPFE